MGIVIHELDAGMAFFIGFSYFYSKLGFGIEIYDWDSIQGFGICDRIWIGI